MGCSSESGESFIQHFIHLTVVGAVTDGIADDFTIVQVKHRREIKLAPKQGKLGRVGYPFLIWPFCMEISCQQIWLNLACLPDFGLKVLWRHKTYAGSPIFQSAYRIHKISLMLL